MLLHFTAWSFIRREVVSGIQAKYPASSVGQWITYWDHQVGFPAPFEMVWCPFGQSCCWCYCSTKSPIGYTVFSFPWKEHPYLAQRHKMRRIHADDAHIFLVA